MNAKHKRQLESWNTNRAKQQSTARNKQTAEQLQRESVRLTAKLKHLQELEEQATAPAEQSRIRKAFEKTFSKLTKLMYKMSSARKPQQLQ